MANNEPIVAIPMIQQRKWWQFWKSPTRTRYFLTKRERDTLAKAAGIGVTKFDTAQLYPLGTQTVVDGKRYTYFHKVKVKEEPNGTKKQSTTSTYYRG